MARHTTTGGHLTIETPEGAGWSLEPLVGQNVVGFKCKLVGPDLFFMLAKVYVVPQEQATSAEKLLRETYVQSYAKMFAKVNVEDVRMLATGTDGMSWWEAHYLLEHDRIGTVRKIERVATMGASVFLCSAEGHEEPMRTNAAIVRGWFDRAHFGPNSLALSIARG